MGFNYVISMHSKVIIITHPYKNSKNFVYKKIMCFFLIIEKCTVSDYLGGRDGEAVTLRAATSGGGQRDMHGHVL